MWPMRCRWVVHQMGSGLASSWSALRPILKHASILRLVQLPSGKQPVPYLLTLVPPLALALSFPDVFFFLLDLAGTYGMCCFKLQNRAEFAQPQTQWEFGLACHHLLSAPPFLLPPQACWSCLASSPSQCAGASATAAPRCRASRCCPADSRCCWRWAPARRASSAASCSWRSHSSVLACSCRINAAL